MLLPWLNAPRRLITPLTTSAAAAARSCAFFTLTMRMVLRWRFFLPLESLMT